MTEPLTPPECDLRGMPFMPVDLVRLFDSDIYALSSGDEFKAAFTLWGKAFLQVPAGSLPNDDRILAHLSGAGSRWLRVKDMALRGWVECSDGRLYHAVVSEKAREAWQARLAQRARTEAARAARAQKRQDSDNGNAPPVAKPVTADATEIVTSSVTENVTGSKGQGQGQLKEEERTTSLRSVDAVPASIDARTELFRTGLSEVRRLTGLTDGRARSLLGKCLKAAEDNAAAVSMAIARCADARPANAVPWLLQACEKPQFRNGFLAVIADEGWSNQPDDEPEPPNPFLIGSAVHGPH